jgi:ribonuclease HI
MAYVSRSLEAQVSPASGTSPDPDFLQLNVTSPGYHFTIINIYNEGDQQGSPLRTIERMLRPLTISHPTLVLGDFNTHHHWWDPLSNSTSPLADQLVEWVHDQKLELLNEPGVGTFSRPNMRHESVLDLSFATQDLASLIDDWQVMPSVGSDHLAILFTLRAMTPNNTSFSKPPQRFNSKKADWDLFANTLSDKLDQSQLQSLLRSIPSPSPEISKSLLEGADPNLEVQLDQLAQGLTDAISEAAKMAIPFIQPGPRSKPWWNDSLRELRSDFIRKQRSYRREVARSTLAESFLWKRDYLLARNTYFEAIKAAKRDHWNSFLEKEDPKSIFKAMKYTVHSTSQRIPSIRSASTLEDSFDGKCSAFRNTLFPAPPQAEPPVWDSYIPSSSAWEWPCLSRIELQEACSSKVKSKTPGPDNITQDIVIVAHRGHADLMFQIFSAFFNIGYHPRCWKQATGVILKKSAKPDYAQPKAYRVISLLNCLGKVLERILAKRLGVLAEVTHLLHPSQIGGRCRKSAIDAGLLLLNEVQKQRKLGRMTSTVFLDIKGAFDHVAMNQLLTILAKLRLPWSLIAWTRSFLTDRELRLSFDGQTQPFSPIQAGIPQGSPISPILFLIYIRDLFESTINFSLSYMDDLSISVASTSLKKNIRILQREIASLFAKGDKCAIQFDAAKTELIHFTTSQKAPLATLTLPDRSIIKPNTVVKWLGIQFDSSLSFKPHINSRVSQAKSAFYRMCRLANKERGLSPFAMRQLYMACVVSVADFASPIYWKGQEYATAKHQSLQNLALQKILGTFRTTPTRPSELEAALPPPEIRLNSNLRMYAFRARKLPDSHPIKQAISPIWTSAHHELDSSTSDSYESDDSTTLHRKGTPSQLLRIAESIQHCLTWPEEQISYFHFRPWNRATPFAIHISKLAKAEEAIRHNAEMTSLLGSDLLAIYSDASSVPKGKGIGVGLTVLDMSRQGKQVYQDTINLGKGQIVYNGELEGITRAFEYAADVVSPFQEVRIHADNQAAIHRLSNPSDNPGQIWQLRCFAAAELIVKKGATVSLHWVPGHHDVEGNEIADALAKAAAISPPSSNLTSLAMTGIRVKDIAHQEWVSELREYVPKAIRRNPNTYSNKFKWKIRKRLAIPIGTRRETASTFYQLKIGHGYFKSYLAGIDKCDSSCCSCGAKQTPEHLLLSCPLFSLARKELVNNLKEKKLTLPLLLHTKKGIASTLAFIESTKMATRKWHLGMEAED